MNDLTIESIEGRRRILLWRATGSGEPALAARLAAGLARSGAEVGCLCADPGSPTFGIPGALCLGKWQTDAWQLAAFEPLCSLDALRFRLPLVQALGRLLERHPHAPLLIEAPRTDRGGAAAELLTALLEAVRPDAAILLGAADERDRQAALRAQLDRLSIPVHRVGFPERAAPSRHGRAVRRTVLWDAHLQGAHMRTVAIRDLVCIGAPPPLATPESWIGRQAALLRGRSCLAMGEIAAFDGVLLTLRLRGTAAGAAALLVRDAQRSTDGLLRTAAVGKQPAADRGIPVVSAEHVARPPTSRGRGFRAAARAGPFAAALANGIFGDPLLLVRLRYGRRCLLFDIGDAGNLRARIAHDVSDVFISHAHIDHVAGFLWLLRSRIGMFPPCRVYGPPGLAANVAGTVAGVHWDRIGERAPRFEIAELHGDSILHFTVTAGQGAAQPRGETRANDGVLLADPLLQVRAAVLDHRTPVLAYALESRIELKVRKDRLAALRLTPGPWLTQLKRAVAEGEHGARLVLPDGSERPADALARELLIECPGTKLAYATDLADTAPNRERLVQLARGASVLFCEATFREADAARAALTGHLTARACGEIATAADVARLIPFHFSRRYETEPEAVFAEIKAACKVTVLPGSLGSA